MNINATLLGEVIFVFAVVIGIVSYYLGQRKTEHPLVAGILGFVLSLIPPIGLIFVSVLLFKQKNGVSVSPKANS